MEGTVPAFHHKAGETSPTGKFFQVDTTNILFICGGAFAGLDKKKFPQKDKGSSIGLVQKKSIEEKKTGEWMKGLNQKIY
ncbi:MAG: hypothetical protein CM15mL9_310 [uncultured marine virus]|nr:MAG: hypothetical protein CM15mL9_310 [uncultured marine virus]